MREDCASDLAQHSWWTLLEAGVFFRLRAWVLVCLLACLLADLVEEVKFGSVRCSLMCDGAVRCGVTVTGISSPAATQAAASHSSELEDY